VTIYFHIPLNIGRLIVLFGFVVAVAGFRLLLNSRSAAKGVASCAPGSSTPSRSPPPPCTPGPPFHTLSHR